MAALMTMALSRPVFCKKDAPGPKKRTQLKPKDVRRAIQQAQMLCYNFEDTPQCRVAWEQVEELSSELARQREEELYRKNLEDQCIEDPHACREYDV
jgi:hypothetical protein